MLSPIFALSANLCFSISTIYFAHYSARITSVWMNTVKAMVSLVFFILVVLATQTFTLLPWQTVAYLLTSGFIGLGCGDLFLLNGFVMLGPARTLVLFSFQPIIFLFTDSLIFGEVLKWNNIVAVFIFILCLVLFSTEHYRRTRTWNILGLAMAIAGVALDGTGVFFTKNAFHHSVGLDSTYANVIRNLGALSFYFIYSFFKPIDLVKKFIPLNKQDKMKVFLFSFLGTFLSLFFYLKAIKLGRLSIVTAISITSPLFATFFESAINKRAPSKTLLLCLVLFIGSYFLNLL